MLASALRSDLQPLAQSDGALLRADHRQGDPVRIVPLSQAFDSSIDRFINHYNRHCKPFIWTASADLILAKLDDFHRGFAGQHISSLSYLTIINCSWPLFSLCHSLCHSLGQGATFLDLTLSLCHSLSVLVPQSPFLVTLLL